MAFTTRSRLRKPQLRTFTVLIRLLVPSAGLLVGTLDDGVDDAPEMLPDHPRGVQDRLHTAVRRPLQPSVPTGQRLGSAAIVPEVRGRLLQLPGLRSGGCPRGASQTPASRRVSSVRGPSGAATWCPERSRYPPSTVPGAPPAAPSPRRCPGAWPCGTGRTLAANLGS